MTILFRLLLALFAIALIFFGVVMSISPIPFGFVFVILGIFLLAAAAPAFLRWMRKRWRWLDRLMHRIENVLPEWLARPLRATDHDHEEEEEEGKNEKSG